MDPEGRVLVVCRECGKVEHADAASDDAPAQDDDATVPDEDDEMNPEDRCLQQLAEANAARPPIDERPALEATIKELCAALGQPPPPLANMQHPSLRVYLQALQRKAKARDEQKSAEAAPADDSEGS
jgi:hypothetical protein